MAVSRETVFHFQHLHSMLDLTSECVSTDCHIIILNYESAPELIFLSNKNDKPRSPCYSKSELTIKIQFYPKKKALSYRCRDKTPE